MIKFYRKGAILGDGSEISQRKSRRERRRKRLPLLARVLRSRGHVASVLRCDSLLLSFSLQHPTCFVTDRSVLSSSLHPLTSIPSLPFVLSSLLFLFNRFARPAAFYDYTNLYRDIPWTSRLCMSFLISNI